MIMDNENKKLSLIGKRIIERKIEKDDNLKLLLNKNKTKKKEENKIFD